MQATAAPALALLLPAASPRQPRLRLIPWSPVASTEVIDPVGTSRAQEEAAEKPAVAEASAPAAPEAADPPGLVERCRRGEHRAYAELFRTYRAQIAGHLYRLLGGPAELEDALQDTFIEAFRSIDRFRGDAKLSTWLHGIAIHIALRRLRSRGRQLPQTTVEPAPLVADAQQARTLEARRRLARVTAILETLAPKKRIVFVLHEIEGLALTEIARLVGAPEITVRTRLHYARKEFFARAAADPLFDGLAPPSGDPP
jgi:RNA polymerase sigma-70 factor (ECF subfamily)